MKTTKGLKREKNVFDKCHSAWSNIKVRDFGLFQIVKNEIEKEKNFPISG